MRRGKVMCLWCGAPLALTPGQFSSYCGRTHRVKASYERRIRRQWDWAGCDAPHAPAYAERGLALVHARRHSGELFVCRCGLYHSVDAGEGGLSPVLTDPSKRAYVGVQERSDG